MEQTTTCTVANSVRLIVVFGLLSFLFVHNAALHSLPAILSSNDDENDIDYGEEDRPRIRGQLKTLSQMIVDTEQLNTTGILGNGSNTRIERIHSDSNSSSSTSTSSTSSTSSKPEEQIKIHIWNDETDYGIREAILENEAWFEYNGKAMGDPDDSVTQPWFQLTEDSEEADLIVWITVMARHEMEVAPMDPIKHAPHKVIVLDYADGATIHKKRNWMIGNETELGYFKRSFVRHGENNSFKNNVTSPDTGILPYAYSGSRAMMIPPGIPEADRNHEPILENAGMIYGKIAAMSSQTTDTNKDDGYFKDRRYQNFLIPYKERLWNIVNVIRYYPSGPNKSRNKVVEWTREFSQKMVGPPRTVRTLKEELRKSSKPNETIHDASFKAYVGEVDNFCKARRCFGPNYFRLLRDAKIIVTCNPSGWEGDFRLYEAFLSGAMVMVDRMFVLDWMPNTPIDGKHWVTYDPANKTDLWNKLSYYTDPANLEEAETIAKNGYEFVLRYHMTVNRVDYILNHDTVRNRLMKNIQDPAKREIFGYPPL